MRGLIGMECSCRVRDAFRAKGHCFVSCDLKPCEVGKHHAHIHGEVLSALLDDSEWDFVGLHPTCTYLCCSGLFRNRNNPERQQKTEDAVQHVLALVGWLKALDIPKWYIENPIGCLSTRWRKPNQIIQPYQFGEDASKKTCLWLHGLPPLKPTKYIEPRVVDGKPRWSNQTDSGQNRLTPGENRAADRSRTYQGIANAMAQQWGL